MRYAGVHKHGLSNDKLCKRYLFYLEMIVKAKAAANKKVEGIPLMLYLREVMLFMRIHKIFKGQILAVVRSLLDGRCPPLPPRPPTRPPPPPTRVRSCPPTCCRVLRAPTGDVRSHTLSCCHPVPLYLLVYPHRTCTEHTRERTTKCTDTAPRILTHIPVRTNASPSSAGLAILAGSPRRDLKRCWLATNAC